MRRTSVTICTNASARGVFGCALAAVFVCGALGCSLQDTSYLQAGSESSSGASGSEAGAADVTAGGGNATAAGGTSSSGGMTSTGMAGSSGHAGFVDVEADPAWPVLACGSTPCADPTTIMDMESNDGRTCATAGRAGYWLVFNDGTGSQWPLPGGPLAFSDPLPACRGKSAVALHTKGSGFTSWGAGSAIHFSDKGWDASAYRGIIFWAMSSTSTKLSIGVVSAETQDVAYGGSCVPGGGKQCADHFATSRTLNPSWVAYTITFAELQQGGWGVPAPSSKIDASKLMELNMTFGVGAFDVWIDDVGFTN